MKTLVTILATGAAVAGVLYLLRDNEQVKDTLERAKEKASGSWDKVKGSFYQAQGETKSQLADL